VAVSLAYALGFTGKRVLLADANFRNNELTRLFHAPELINNGMNSLVLPNNTTEVTKRIDVAGTGQSSMTPSEIMPDYAWRSLFDRWRRDYDYVIVECRSLVHYNDTEELMPYADKVIAIYPSYSMISRADRRTLDLLQEYGNKFGGVVINQIRNDDMGDLVGDVSRYTNNGGTPWYSRVFRNRNSVEHTHRGNIGGGRPQESRNQQGGAFNMNSGFGGESPIGH
jgi:Mrp family chromosome partitioning ATPase